MCLKFATVIAMSSLLVIGCKQVHKKEEIIQAMKQYDQLLVNMDANALSLAYAPDGMLGQVAKGRDSIRRFLSSFAGFKVLRNESVTKAVEMQADSATQTGTYRQITILPSKDTAHITGTFEAHWVHIPSEGWKIKSMITTPAQ